MATLTIIGNDLVRDPGIETVIVILLFTNKRANSAIDTLPDNTDDLQGYWGDTFEDESLGSKLWLEFRSKTTSDIEDKVKQRAEEALKELIDQGVAKSINVSVERTATYTIWISVELEEPDGQQRFYKYSFNWKAEELKRGI